MAALLGAFLLWLFATGKYSDWLALLTKSGTTAKFSAAASVSSDTKVNNAAGNDVTPSEAIKAGSDYVANWSSSSDVNNDATNSQDNSGTIYA